MSRSDSLRQVEAPLPTIGGSGLSEIPAPEVGWSWWHVPTEGVATATVVSKVAWFYAHWAKIGAGRAVACCRCQQDARGACPMCDLGHERRLRYVLAVECDCGLRLLELGRLQYAALVAIESMSGLVGARVRVTREGRGKTAPIVLQAFGYDPTACRREQHIAEWVSTQGQREFLQWRRDRRDLEQRQKAEESGQEPTPLRFG